MRCTSLVLCVWLSSAAVFAAGQEIDIDSVVPVATPPAADDPWASLKQRIEANKKQNEEATAAAATPGGVLSPPVEATPVAAAPEIPAQPHVSTDASVPPVEAAVETAAAGGGEVPADVEDLTATAPPLTPPAMASEIPVEMASPETAAAAAATEVAAPEAVAAPVPATSAEEASAAANAAAVNAAAAAVPIAKTEADLIAVETLAAVEAQLDRVESEANAAAEMPVDSVDPVDRVETMASMAGGADGAVAEAPIAGADADAAAAAAAAAATAESSEEEAQHLVDERETQELRARDAEELRAREGRLEREAEEQRQRDVDFARVEAEAHAMQYEQRGESDSAAPLPSGAADPILPDPTLATDAPEAVVGEPPIGAVDGTHADAFDAFASPPAMEMIGAADGGANAVAAAAAGEASQGQSQSNGAASENFDPFSLLPDAAALDENIPESVPAHGDDPQRLGEAHDGVGDVGYDGEYDGAVGVHEGAPESAGAYGDMHQEGRQEVHQDGHQDGRSAVENLEAARRQMSARQQRRETFDRASVAVEIEIDPLGVAAQLERIDENGRFAQLREHTLANSFGGDEADVAHRAHDGGEGSEEGEGDRKAWHDSVLVPAKNLLRASSPRVAPRLCVFPRHAPRPALRSALSLTLAPLPRTAHKSGSQRADSLDSVNDDDAAKVRRSHHLPVILYSLLLCSSFCLLIFLFAHYSSFLLIYSCSTSKAVYFALCFVALAKLFCFFSPATASRLAASLALANALVGQQRSYHLFLRVAAAGTALLGWVVNSTLAVLALFALAIVLPFVLPRWCCTPRHPPHHHREALDYEQLSLAVKRVVEQVRCSFLLFAVSSCSLFAHLPTTLLFFLLFASSSRCLRSAAGVAAARSPAPARAARSLRARRVRCSRWRTARSARR